MFGRAFKLSGIPLCILTQCSSFRRNGNFSEGRGASLEITGGGAAPGLPSCRRGRFYRIDIVSRHASARAREENGARGKQDDADTFRLRRHLELNSAE
jgi:hypothetical protein